MVIRLEQEDIQSIAKEVSETLRLLFANKTDKKESDFLMTVADLAEYLKCSRDLIYKLTAAKEIPHIKNDKKFLLFRKSQIDKWLDSHSVPTVNIPISILKKIKSST